MSGIEIVYLRHCLATWWAALYIYSKLPTSSVRKNATALMPQLVSCVNLPACNFAVIIYTASASSRAIDE